jgi:hypothetical protein
MQLRSIVRRNAEVEGAMPQLRGQGEVSMCFLLAHGMVRTHAVWGERCTHRTSAPQKSSSRSVGHPTCCWCQLVDTRDVLGSAASSTEASHPSARAADSAGWVRRYALGMERPGGVSGGCDVWDVRTPLPAFLERSPALQAHRAPNGRVLRCRGVSTTSTARSREVGSGMCSETER